MTGQRNHEDSRRKSEAVKAGMARRAVRGEANGGPPTYGYRYQGPKGEQTLVVYAPEAIIVVRIFAEFTSGKSITAIARELHRDGIPTLKGGLWRQSTVSGILRNPRYIGKIVHNGEVLDGNHEAIVDVETFDRVHAILETRPDRNGGRPPKGRHLFRGGMLRCECGEAMVPRTNGGYEMYYCNGRSKFGKGHCPMPHVRRALIDEAVYRYFEKVGLDVEATRRQLRNERDRKVAEVRALRGEADREAQRAQERLSRVRRDYQDGRLAADDWSEQRAQLTAEAEAASAEAERLAKSEADIETASELIDAERDALTMLAEIRQVVAGEVQSATGTDAVRAALSRLFSAFILHPQRNPRYQGQGRAELVDAGDELMVELQVREQALQGYTESGMYPVLRREAIVDNQREALPIR